MKISFKSPKKDFALVKITKSDISRAVVSASGIILEISVKEPEKINDRKLRVLARQIVFLAKQNKIKNIAINLKDFYFPNAPFSDYDLGFLLAVNFGVANYEFVKFKEEPKEGWNFIKEIFVFPEVSFSAKKGFKDGIFAAKRVNQCRDLANLPGGDMTPSLLAKEAQKAIKNLPITANIFSEDRIKKLKMGGVLGVAKGSKQKPKFIVLEYKNSKKDPIVFVGKGVTFDTGGLNLKPSNSILQMNMDMSGGAAVIEAVALAAELKLKVNVVALVPAVENMPSGESYRPGDVLKTMSGKTIEVLNTDAEGRIILADALTYAKKYKPKLVVDVATLTGASMVALGQRMSALFSNKKELLEKIYELGEKSGNYVWPMPLGEEYENEIKGEFADVANVGKLSPYGGAITAAEFLHQFAKDFDWVHIDMAPRMVSVDGEFLAKGATGEPVLLLLEILKSIEKSNL